MRLSHTMRTRSRRLRREMTEQERVLWRALRGGQMGGLKFRRQHPCGPYILDFVCIEAGLVIEVDGGQHAENPEPDAARDVWLIEHSFTVLRFWNSEIMTELEVVLQRILLFLRNKYGVTAECGSDQFEPTTPAA